MSFSSITLEDAFEDWEEELELPLLWDSLLDPPLLEDPELEDPEDLSPNLLLTKPESCSRQNLAMSLELRVPSKGALF